VTIDAFGSAAGGFGDKPSVTHAVYPCARFSVNQRRRREEILSGVLRSLFARKDSQRGFTAEQRRIMWNGSANRSCAHRGCGKRLTWDDFTIDHIKPHSKGGQSQLENAALMCRAHNSSKVNRG
jgi:5-methylcytosine-specific restriction endonuclease McrA